MKSLLSIARLAVVALLASGASAFAAPAVGQPAPAFTLKDSNGTAHSLSDFKGKYVVLEWFNPACPFVVKHYGSGNMQKLQKQFTDKGVVWLTVNSTSPKSGDFLDAAATNAKRKEWNIVSTADLLDPMGTVGKAYDARTTPHMYIIDPQGKLIYNGAIDSDRSANPSAIATATNYVMEALTAAMGGKPVATASTRPYGCGVKY